MGRIHTLRTLPRRFAWWASTPSGLLWLFALGLAVRLLLATRPGFWVDMNSFRGWSNDLAERGMGEFYPPHVFGEEGGRGGFVDYPPGYLYVLWFLGKLSRLLFGGPPSDLLLKLPPVLGDLLLAWLVVRLASRLTPATYRRVPWRGIAASAILLNPGLMFVSAVWGQVDVFMAVLIVAAVLVVATGPPTFVREVAGSALLVAAVLTKPQASFVVPALVLVLVWRHVRAAAADPAPGRMATAVARLAAIGATSAVAAVLISLPFGMGPVRLVRFLSHASGTYPQTSVWAFNLWGVVGFWKPDSGSGAYPSPALPALVIGLALFVLGAALVLARAWRTLNRGESEARVLLLAGVSITLVAFAVLTRIHERYLFFAVSALACFAAYRAFRWALFALSGLYLLNVWFAYAYYTFFYEQAGSGPHRTPSELNSAVFRAIYGDPGQLDTPQRALLSLAGGLLCLVVALLGWRWLEGRSGADRAVAAPEPPRRLATVTPTQDEPRVWGWVLHPVGTRGAAIALAVFALALGTKLVGLGNPPGMYFDEVYHARTAGEYLQGREVYEWTHPPLAKQLMALSVRWLSGFRAEAGEGGPRVASPLASGGGHIFASSNDGRTVVRLDVEEGCTLRASGRRLAPATGRVSAIAADGERVTVGTADASGGSVHRFERGRPSWSATLPSAPVSMAHAAGSVFVVTEAGDLLYVDARAEVAPLDAGAAAVSDPDSEGHVWVTFPDRGSVTSFGPDGDRRESASVTIRPGPVEAPVGGDRVLVAAVDETIIESVDPQSHALADKPDLAHGADLMASAPRTGLTWAAEGTRVHVIEPRGLAVIGGVDLPGFPTGMAALETGGVVVASVPGSGLVCMSGDAPFAWRFGSAVTGAAMVALVFLLGLRLFGSTPAALLAALFLAVCGLAFTMSRIAMNDSYVTAFFLAAWFCAASALWRWGEGAVRKRPAAIGWLVATGVFSGLAIASKWVGLFALAGIGLLFLWNLVSRKRDGLWSIAGNLPSSLAVLAVIGLLIPLTVYVVAYIPYFQLGNSFGDLLRLQRDMFGYHSGLAADHPYGSPWWGWPFGYRAVYLFLHDPAGPTRAEMWTAPNPVVFWAGLVAMIALGGWAWRRRSVGGAVVLLGALVQYLPWVRVTRVIFLYHYLSVVPFLTLALGWWLAGSRDESDPEAGRWRRAETYLVAGAAVAVFVVMQPFLQGWAIDGRLLDALKNLMPWAFAG